ncbi:C-terminal binding protein [Alkalihalobacillus oceani]|uniref:C-terminal binding protein n=1 Tax=Halalkalibacter oceani TaxID=1653776 RepID=UPI00203DDDAA|nr:C-terminal binding protein [Halalkalibacter oceani]MCM3759978.1 C-terminal binding protein [Halalkalibacter oceani]
MGKFKVVVTDFEYSSLDIEREVLEGIGAELIPAQCRTEDEVLEAVKEADAILNQYAPLSEKIINKLNNCKVIAKYGIGVNTVDIKAATEAGILVCNVSDYCLDEVSDHAFALLIACARKVVKLNAAIKEDRLWDFKQGVPVYRLKNRTLGLVGLGSIPRALVPKAQAFGLKVMAFDPFVSAEVAAALNVELVSLEELCQKSDYLSIHAPLTEQTRGMIKAEHFKLMKNEAFLINTARGPVVDEAALIFALQNGEIAGAGLDVVETEPIAVDHPFLKMDHVILNPHVAWYSVESEQELKRKCAENVAAVLTGYYPPYMVNKEVKPKIALKAKQNLVV